MADNYTQPGASCPPSIDASFGPSVPQSCRGGFDFTLLFEQSILAIPPSALLLLLAPPRIYLLLKSSTKVIKHHGGQQAIKTAVTVILAVLQLSLVILWAIDPSSRRTSASIPAAVLALLDALLLAFFSNLEHTRTAHPSTLINLYLLFSLVLDIPQSRTLFLRGDLDTVAGVFTASIGVKSLLLVLESTSKRKVLAHPYKAYPPEATGSIFNRTFLWWLNPLFWKGIKGLFTLNDLFEIDPALSSEMLGKNLQKSWEQRAKPEGSLALVWACIKCLRWPLLLVVPPRLALVGFNYAQPFLISRLISFVSEPQTAETRNISLGLIAAAALVYGGIAVFTVRYMHQLYRFITMLRGALTSLIFNKTLAMRDGVFDESAAVTLMSTDIDRIALSLQNLNEVWARTLEIALGIWLLARQLGWVAVIPIALIAVCVAANTQLSKFISSKQKVWNAAVQKRIGTTSNTLGSMKSVKMVGLVSTMSAIIQQLRIDELASAMGYRWLVVWTNMIAYTPLIWAPVLTFVTFVAASHQGLNVQTAFTSLSIITLVTQPATQLLTAITESAACLGCFTRIQSFLMTPSFEDTRLSPRSSQSAVSTPPSDVSRDKSAGLHEKESGTVISSISTGFKTSMSASMRSDSQITLCLQHCTVKPAPTSDPAVFDISFQLLHNQVAVITGPVASGKTTLLRAILGEVSLEEGGSIFLSSKRLAFCAQDPWITNVTLQQTITGLKVDDATDEKWYASVVHACALEEDFALFPEGDQSIPGSRGLTLSGGQKQRLALARAIYSRSEIIVLDDVFSALDANTEAHVIERLLGHTGLLKALGATVVLATHSPRPIPFADHLIVLTKDGKILSQGPPSVVISAGAIDEDMAIAATSDGSKDLKPAKKKPVIKKPSDNDVDDLTRRTGDVAVYKYYFKSVGLLPTLGFLFVTTAFVVASYFPQIWLEWWSNDNGSHFSKYVSVYIVLAVLAWIFRALTLWWMLVYISPISSARLHHTMLKTAMAAPMSFFAKTDTGLIVNRFSQDIGLIDRNLPLSSGRVLTQLATIMAQAALICQGSAYMAATLPLLLVAVYVLQKIYLLTSRQMRFLDLEGRSPVYTIFLETLSGVATIRAFAWQNATRERSIKSLDQSQRPYYLLYCIQRWLNLVLDLIVAAMAVIVVALAVRIPGQSSPAAIGIALNNVLGFSQALRVMVDAWTQLETSLGGIARLKNFELTVLPEHLSGENVDPGECWPSLGRVEFRNVFASYTDSVSVLKGINLLVESGQKLGICGRTGSGKSSLLLALLRLLELDSGTIFIDGIDIQTVPRNLLRERLVTISQDSFILSDTVRKNLDPHNLSTDFAMSEALGKVQLLDTISARGGLDVHMKEQPLSQGQQQLFCLARAILQRGKILVLDEATSNVDGETDTLMQKVIREEFAGRTIITVAHRLDTILDGDAIAVLEAGEVAEFGSPKELLARDGSKFAEMYARGALPD